MTEPIEQIVATDGHEGHWYTGEEIIRCRDCKHSCTLESAPSVVVRCCYKNRDKLGVPRVVGDDGFCAWGEVRAGSSEVRAEGGRMTATDRLRAMLDERGVEWTAVSKDVTMDNQTYCYPHTFTEFQDGLMVTNLTPEQAIAATLGAGTCWMIYDEEASGDELYPTEAYHCSECGKWVYAGKPNYCPSCGARVVDE